MSLSALHSSRRCFDRWWHQQYNDHFLILEGFSEDDDDDDSGSVHLCLCLLSSAAMTHEKNIIKELVAATSECSQEPTSLLFSINCATWRAHFFRHFQLNSSQQAAPNWSISSQQRSTSRDNLVYLIFIICRLAPPSVRPNQPTDRHNNNLDKKSPSDDAMMNKVQSPSLRHSSLCTVQSVRRP